MNKIVLALAVCMAVSFCGCLEVPLGYTPETEIQPLSHSKKYTVTYSVDYISDGDVSMGRANEAMYINWLGEYLQKTNAFSKVAYRNFTAKSNYHIHFLIHYSAMPVNEAAVTVFLMGYTLTAIPMWVNMYLDVSAIVYLNQKPVFSSATAEDVRCYVWLPFLPVGLVWNQFWVWTIQEKKVCRYLINEVVKYQTSLTL